MKDKILSFLKKIIDRLEVLHIKYAKKEVTENAYSSLSPISNGDEDGHYSKALLWALKNRKSEDIKNIALTGPYGSGKSSILKTFQKNYKGKELKFLNISLATFKEEKRAFDGVGTEIKVEKVDLLRLIEISILEQIFYHEEDKNIPDSRFKKIKSYSSRKLFFLSLGYLAFLIALYSYFNPFFIQNVFKDVAITDTICSIIHYSEIAIILLGVFFAIRKSARLISALTIRTLKIQDAEIGLGDDANKSILNHHIDEILYFFSVRPYNVVIIEDLDRFEETEIFTKLREVNLLLNNSQKTKRKEITFVYAVRDDMFSDKERTKFFDFIIPVIPVINSSNSSELLFKKKKQFKYFLSDGLIEDISFFIDDMRLLHNISNEFYLYKEKLSENLNQDKLFAIITYKNIYPNDFMKLSNNEGDLYEIFDSKFFLIRNIISDIDIKIEEHKNQIKEYDSLFIDNLKDLRSLYIISIIENLPGFQSFYIDNKNISINEVRNDQYFEYLKADNYSYNQIRFNEYQGRVDSRQLSFVAKFNEIEKLINPSKSYSTKESEIREFRAGKRTLIKNKIQELEKEKVKIRNSKICDLISNQSSSIEIKDSLNINFITILLRNAYIDESYIDYISIFHEESITRADHQFHINVKNQTKQPFDYKLLKMEKLVSKINPLDFQTEFILNYDILDYLLSNSEKYSLQLESMFGILKNESKISAEFIRGYFEVSEKLEKFIRILCNKWTNIWGFIESDIDFSDDFSKAFFKSIIEFAEVTAILQISKVGQFVKYILSDPLFLNITDNQDKLKRVVEELKIVFTKIDFENTNDEMLLYMYENNLYQLNNEMIISVLKMYGAFNSIEFDRSNFFAIKNSNAPKLIEYVEEDINIYVEEIYLKISTNVYEKEDYLIDLLNNENLKINSRELIISQVQTKIKDLLTIRNFGLYSKLLRENRVVASWGNLLTEYNSNEIEKDENDEVKSEKQISKATIQFINIIENAELLSKIKIPKEVNSINIYGEFWKKLIQSEEIHNHSYDFIVKSAPWPQLNLNFENLSENKIQSLIDNNCISPVAKEFISLKETSEGWNIYLLEKNKINFLKILDQLTFDDSDLTLILKSSILNNSEKNQILITCPEQVIMQNSILKLLSPILIADNAFIVSDTILHSLLLNSSVVVLERIKLFIRNAAKYDLVFVETFLKNLGGVYSAITDNSLKAKIPKTIDNRNLMEILVNKGYISSFSDRISDFRVNHKRK